MNAKTIDKALDIQKYLDEGLRELLDVGFLSRAECEYYLRLDENEQKRAADVFEKIKKMNPLLPERKKIKKSMTQALTELVTIADIEERDRAFAKAVQEAEEAVAAAKPAGGKPSAGRRCQPLPGHRRQPAVRLYRHGGKNLPKRAG